MESDSISLHGKQIYKLQANTTTELGGTLRNDKPTIASCEHFTGAWRVINLDEFKKCILLHHD